MNFAHFQRPFFTFSLAGSGESGEEDEDDDEDDDDEDDEEK